MERYPLYYNHGVGGLSPIQSPDIIDSTVLPTFADQIVVQSNRVTLLDSVGNHLLVPVTEPLLNDLANDYLALDYNTYSAVSFETDADGDLGYKLADKDAWVNTEVLVGVCLGVIETTTVDMFVFQLSGKLTPLVNKGDTIPLTPPSIGLYGYVGTTGAITTSYTSGKRLIVLKSVGTSAMVVSGDLLSSGGEGGLSHNVLSAISSYLSVSGLTATVAANTYVYFHEGTFNKHVNLAQQSVAVPANQVSHIYAKPDGTLEARAEPYLVTADEAHTFATPPTLIDHTFVNSATYRSSNINVYDNRRIGATGFSWGQAKTLAAPVDAAYYYYELTYVGGLKNAQVGIYVDDCTVSNNYFSISTTNTKGALHFNVNTTSNTLANVLGEWTVHYTAAIGTMPTNVRISWLVNSVTQQVYLAINGTWLNSGSPVATFIAPLAGRMLIPVFSAAVNTVLFTTIATWYFSYSNYPATFLTNQVKRSLATNRTYTLISDVFAYVQLVYLGSVNTTTNTATPYPVKGEYQVSVATSTTPVNVTHKLSSAVVNATVSLDNNANTTITYVDKDTLTVSTSVTANATITVTNHA